MHILKKKDILKGYPENYPLNILQEHNLAILLQAINDFQIMYINSGGQPFEITSGFRSEEHNKRVGGVKGSFHEILAALDIRDDKGDLASFAVNNIYLLEEIELYIEHPMYTKGYVHAQIFSPRSGKRVFIPYAGPVKPHRYNPDFNNLN